MASRTGTVVGFELTRGPDVATSLTSNGGVFNGYVHVINGSASTVIGGTDTLDVELGAALALQRRNGKTCVPRAVAFADNAETATTAYGATCALSSTTLQITPKAETDNSTGATLPANTTALTYPYRIFVSWVES